MVCFPIKEGGNVLIVCSEDSLYELSGLFVEVTNVTESLWKFNFQAQPLPGQPHCLCLLWFIQIC